MEPILMGERQIAVFFPYRKRKDGAHEFFLQRRDAVAPVHANMYSLFGGGIEGIETPVEALKREVWEELRYVPNNAHYLALCGTGYGAFFVFIEEVASDFELHIDIREGVGGRFFTYDEMCDVRDISPIARVVTESTYWYLSSLKDSRIVSK